MEDSVTRVAERIKMWRDEAGLSLQELANRSDVSPSTIHKIEHCQTVPTIAVVLKLASGLGRHATELFDETTAVPTALLTRAEGRRLLTTSRGATIETLSSEHGSRDLRFWRVIHPVGFRVEAENTYKANGEIVLMLEEGAMRVSVGNEHFDLISGDTLHWKASNPASWENTGEGPATALLLGNSVGSLRSALASTVRRSGPAPKAPATQLTPSAAARA